MLRAGGECSLSVANLTHKSTCQSVYAAPSWMQLIRPPISLVCIPSATTHMDTPSRLRHATLLEQHTHGPTCVPHSNVPISLSTFCVRAHNKRVVCPNYPQRMQPLRGQCVHALMVWALLRRHPHIASTTSIKYASYSSSPTRGRIRPKRRGRCGPWSQ